MRNDLRYSLAIKNTSSGMSHLYTEWVGTMTDYSIQSDWLQNPSSWLGHLLGFDLDTQVIDAVLLHSPYGAVSSIGLSINH
jgi:hypothetical protein